MISELSSQQQGAVERMSRDFKLYYGGGLPQFFNDILKELAAGNVGITALARDVDALAKHQTGVFAYNPDTTVGLSLGYTGGVLHNAKTRVVVSAGNVLLAGNATNYVEVDRAGTVTANTTAFTSGRYPLLVVVTGASTVSTVAYAKPVGTLVGPAGIDGELLSARAATKEIFVPLGTVSATASWRILAPATGQIVAATLVVDTTVATSDTNFWDFGIVNKGQAGAGTQTLVDRTAAANSTKVTGGAALTADTRRLLTLVALSGGTERNVTYLDSLVLTATKAASAANLVGLGILLEIKHTD